MKATGNLGGKREGNKIERKGKKEKGRKKGIEEKKQGRKAEGKKKVERRSGR